MKRIGHCLAAVFLLPLFGACAVAPADADYRTWDSADEDGEEGEDDEQTTGDVVYIPDVMNHPHVECILISVTEALDWCREHGVMPYPVCDPPGTPQVAIPEGEEGPEFDACIDRYREDCFADRLDDRYYCDDGVIITGQHGGTPPACDGITDCFDGSDEDNCDLPEGTTCLPQAHGAYD